MAWDCVGVPAELMLQIYFRATNGLWLQGRAREKEIQGESKRKRPIENATVRELNKHNFFFFFKYKSLCTSNETLIKTFQNNITFLRHIIVSISGTY